MVNDGHARNLPRATVLVVEDEDAVADGIVEYLEGMGYQVFRAAIVTEAMHIILSRNVQVVFSDITMPGTLDGLDLVEWAQKFRPALPFLLTSGRGRDPRIGNLPFVPKPYLYRDIDHWLHRLINDRLQ